MDWKSRCGRAAKSVIRSAVQAVRRGGKPEESFGQLFVPGAAIAARGRESQQAVGEAPVRIIKGQARETDEDGFILDNMLDVAVVGKAVAKTMTCEKRERFGQQAGQATAQARRAQK